MQFRLNDAPYYEQLTVHINNYNKHFGLNAFEIELAKWESGKQITPVIENFIRHYGLEFINTFLDEVIHVKASGV